VVGIARDGLEALEKVGELKPDVVTLDLVMPHLDGLGVLRALEHENVPRVVVVSFGDAQSEIGLEALRLGAVALVHKPTNLAVDRLYDLRAELVHAVLEAAAGRPPGRAEVAVPLPPLALPGASRTRLVVVGASTGGPQALTRLLTALPGNFPAPVAVVLHIPIGFTEPFARRLDQECALRVFEAEEGLELVPGRIVIARAGAHLTVAGPSLRAHLDVLPLEPSHRPSVDVLFKSAAETLGSQVLGVVLTGMGDDGLAGSRAIVEAGGTVLAEAESTCVVYGMPRAVAEAGLAKEQVRIGEMAAAVLRNL
jgi:two-component system chemotaxis response regulator CheB